MYRHTDSLDASCPGWHPSALPVIEMSFFYSHHMALPPPTLSLIDFKSGHVFKKRWAVRTGRHWERLAGVLCSCRKVSAGDKRLSTPSFFSPMVNPLLFFYVPCWKKLLEKLFEKNWECKPALCPHSFSFYIRMHFICERRRVPFVHGTVGQKKIKCF